MRISAPAWVLAAVSAALLSPISGSAFADVPKGAAPAGSGGAAGKPADVKANLSPGGGGGPKILHTIPLDGGGSEEIPASSRLVRDVIAVHPHEDLIICIAGCKPGQDRVVYAQPSDPQAKPAPVPVAETAPAPAADTANAPTAEGDKAEPAKDNDTTKAAKADAAAPAATPEPVAAKASEPAAKPEMVPTSSEAPAAPAPEADAAHQPPPSDVDDVQKRLEFNPGTGKVIEK